jgi:hypothetical protein
LNRKKMFFLLSVSYHKRENNTQTHRLCPYMGVVAFSPLSVELYKPPVHPKKKCKIVC